MGALAKSFRKSRCVSAQKNEFARAALTLLAEPFGEILRRETPAGGVQKDDGGGAVRVEFFERRGFVANFGDFDGRVAPHALDVVVQERSQLGPARFAKQQEADAHASYSSPSVSPVPPWILGSPPKIVRGHAPGP